ncbi:MAG TPA: hypothetical protein VEY67_05490 [Candidatus Dormibacteraeota bacterium]|nr:hypothetical protein [Candidatus Dormibacteraeota bacterium]
MRLRREIEVDWARAVAGRVPILSEKSGGFEFNEPAVAVNREPPARGVIGWDPSLGWVLVLEPGESSGTGQSSGSGESGAAARPGEGSDEGQA